MSLSREQILQFNEDRTRDLHPAIIDRAREFLVLCEKEVGVLVLVTEGFRSYEKQAEYYAQGRTKPGKIITRAKPGRSWHQYALGLDHVPVISKLDGRYSAAYDLNIYRNKTIPVALALGFESLIDNKKFPEAPHLQITGGWTIRELLMEGYGSRLPVFSIPIPKP